MIRALFYAGLVVTEHNNSDDAGHTSHFLRIIKTLTWESHGESDYPQR